MNPHKNRRDSGRDLRPAVPYWRMGGVLTGWENRAAPPYYEPAATFAFPGNEAAAERYRERGGHSR